jgi:hypothetical protein
MSRPKEDKKSFRPLGLPGDNANTGPVFTDFVTGRANGRRQPLMDSLGGRYRSALNGREKRGGARTKGSK